MRTTWADTIQSGGYVCDQLCCERYRALAKATKFLAVLSNMRVDMVGRTTEKSVTRGWEYC